MTPQQQLRTLTPDGIFEFSCNSDKVPVLLSDFDILKEHFIGKPMDVANWKSPDFKLYGKSRKRSDLIGLSLQVPVISESGKQKLEGRLSDCCQFVPLITFKKTLYYGINVLTWLDCLDHANSELFGDRRSDGSFILTRARFHTSQIPSGTLLFRVNGQDSTIYATSEFVELIIQHQITGACFADPSKSSLGVIIRGEELNVVPGLP